MHPSSTRYTQFCFSSNAHVVVIVLLSVHVSHHHPHTDTDCKHKETLLHFAARHGLNSLSQHLLSLPGSSEAVLLPNEQGQLPIDIAKEQGNEGLTQLLTM